MFRTSSITNFKNQAFLVSFRKKVFRRMYLLKLYVTRINKIYSKNWIIGVGNTLMVTKIDRCSRNRLEFLKLQDILFKRKIEFISLDLPHSDDPSINRLIATTLSSIAEFEYNRRKKRQSTGIRAAKKKGKYQGRKTIIDKTLIQKVQYLKEQKNLSITDISKVTGVSIPTIYKVLKEHLGYVSNRLVKQEETNEPK